MKLSYEDLISPFGIALNVGTIHQPTLKEIFDPKIVGLRQFHLFEMLMFMTPRDYYTHYRQDQSSYWQSLSVEEQNTITLFDIMEHDEYIRLLYLTMLNFFFEERVEYQSGVFVVLKNQDANLEHITEDDIRGIITPELLSDVTHILRQICGMSAEENEFADLSTKKFKNEKARKMAEKMQRAALQESEQGKANPDLTLPNIISKVCGRHPSINYTNVWNLTLYELMDSFNTIKSNEVYDILKTSVSVWGDEKKHFKENGWYKNQFDSK